MKLFIFAFIGFLLILRGSSQDDETTTEAPADAGGGDAAKDDKPKNGSGGTRGDWSGLDDLAAVIYSVRNISKDEATVCAALKANPPEMKINLTTEFNYDQMLQFLTWSMKHELKSGKPLKFGGELEWKMEIIELIATIFKKECAEIGVPAPFSNIMKELFKIYINSGKNPGAKARKDMWKDQVKMLKKCAGVSTDEEQDDGMPNEAEHTLLNFPLGPIVPPSEIADEMETIDLVIDTFWWMFSFSFGACYPMFKNKPLDSGKLKHMFYKDFLTELNTRWREGGQSPMAYGPIFEDVDIYHTLLNVRTCVTAIYSKHGIEDRQLVRPLELTGHNDTAMQVFNVRNGDTMF